MAKLFNVPIISTAQVPKAFGPTIKELNDLYTNFGDVKQHVKSDFSMLEQPVLDYLTNLKRSKVVIYGIEAHVCVKQTCLDLIERNYEVHIVVDSISSMSYHDRNTGIEAMRDAGAHVTTFQSLAFELARNPGIPQYKELL